MTTAVTIRTAQAFFCWFSLILPSMHVAAIERLSIDAEQTCNYFGELTQTTELYGFESDTEAIEIVERILRHSGLEPNFRITAANVPNAAAVLKPVSGSEFERLVLYSQDFMERVTDRTRTDWAAISILAHEIGHHLQGHTLLSGGSRPSIELEADKYSGFIVAMLGGSLDDAQAAIQLISSETGSATHPPKSARLAAITNGWKQANAQLSDRSDRTDVGTTSEAGVKERLLSDMTTYHLGDEEIRSRKWRPLHGQCLDLAFNAAHDYQEIQIIFDTYGSESRNAISINGNSVATVTPQSPRPGSKRPNYWSPENRLSIRNPQLLSRNSFSVCADYATSPEFAGDKDDFQISNIVVDGVR